MAEKRKKDPLEGKTLKHILEKLLEYHDWDGLAAWVNIRCFTHDPTIQSSLKFLRKTPWARAKIEKLYCDNLKYGEIEEE